MISSHQKNIATFIHLSTFSRFFIPLGNFIGPLILWTTNKNKSQFIDAHGKEIINFQLSVLLYAIIIGTISIPFFLFNLLSSVSILDFHGCSSFNINIGKPSALLYIGGTLGVLAFIGFILELIFILKASFTAREGGIYQYPLTIRFLK